MWHVWGELRCIQGFGGETRGRETTWKTHVRWDGNIKMDLREVGWGGGHGLDRSGSGYEKVAGCCECDDEPADSIKLGNFLSS